MIQKISVAIMAVLLTIITLGSDALAGSPQSSVVFSVSCRVPFIAGVNTPEALLGEENSSNTTEDQTDPFFQEVVSEETTEDGNQILLTTIVAK